MIRNALDHLLQHHGIACDNDKKMNKKFSPSKTPQSFFTSYTAISFICLSATFAVSKAPPQHIADAADPQL
jgi:hypothetical protein